MVDLEVSEPKGRAMLPIILGQQRVLPDQSVCLIIPGHLWSPYTWCFSEALIGGKLVGLEAPQLLGFKLLCEVAR